VNARKHKRRFRTLLEEAAFVAVMLDRSGRVTFANDYFLGLTGRTRADVLDRDWFELAASNQPGGGASFAIYLPRAAAAADCAG
jgi:PAS domain S-box-containing protein